MYINRGLSIASRHLPPKHSLVIILNSQAIKAFNLIHYCRFSGHTQMVNAIKGVFISWYALRFDSNLSRSLV